MEAAEVMPAYGNALVQHALDEYLRIKTSVSWSPNTVKNYVSTLTVFVAEVRKVLGREPLTGDLNDLTVSKAVKNRWPNSGTSTTHHGVTSRIKTFLKWLPVNGYVTGSLSIYMETNPAYPEVEVPFLHEAQAREVFRVAYAYSPRDAWMIWIGYKLVRRSGELRVMRVGDINPTPMPDAPHGTYRYKRIKTKDGVKVERLIASEREAIDGWLADYERLIGAKLDPTWYLFPKTRSVGNSHVQDRRTRKLVPEHPIADIGPIWREAFKAAGIYEKGFGSHAGRRGNLTDELYALEAAGVPDAMLHVQRKAGHRERRTTARYIRMDEGERQSYQTRQMVDDIRSGKVSAPQAPAPTEERDESQSVAHTEALPDNVVYAPFGKRRAGA